MGVVGRTTIAEFVDDSWLLSPTCMVACIMLSCAVCCAVQCMIDMHWGNLTLLPRHQHFRDAHYDPPFFVVPGRAPPSHAKKNSQPLEIGGDSVGGRPLKNRLSQF